MRPTIQSLGLDRLSRDERIALAMALWDSVVAEGMPMPLSDEVRRELERRADEDDLSPEEGIPWEQVKAESRARLRD